MILDVIYSYIFKNLLEERIMKLPVKRITAIGGGKKAKGNLFSAKKDASGMYVLNTKTSSPVNGNTTNRACNKVYVATLCEAVELLKTGSYLINVVDENHSRALRSLSSVKVEYR